MGCVFVFRCFSMHWLSGALPGQGFLKSMLGKQNWELCCQQFILESLPWSWPLGRSLPQWLSGLEKLRNRIEDISIRVELATKFFFLTAHTVVNHQVHIVFAKAVLCAVSVHRLGNC